MVKRYKTRRSACLLTGEKCSKRNCEGCQFAEWHEEEEET
jgi:hypothetical protein